MEATKPVWQTCRTRSDVLHRDKGTLCTDGSSQAQAFTCTNSGEKSPGTTRTSTLFQTRKPFGEKPFAPHRDHITASVQPFGFVVASILLRPSRSSWRVELENTATYIWPRASTTRRLRKTTVK